MKIYTKELGEVALYFGYGEALSGDKQVTAYLAIDDKVITYGNSYSRPRKTINKEVERRKALTKAITSLKRETRRDIWLAYFASKPNYNVTFIAEPASYSCGR